MKQKKILAAALAAALTLSLTAPALAMEPMTTDGTRWMPVYELVQRGETFPTRVWGAAVELGDMSLTLENSNESDPYQKVVVNVEEDTLISHLVAEVPRQLVLPQSLAVTGLSWMCIGNSISQTARWDLSLLTPPRLKDKMGRMVALMGIAVAADSHVYEDVLPDFLPL